MSKNRMASLIANLKRVSNSGSSDINFKSANFSALTFEVYKVGKTGGTVKLTLGMDENGADVALVGKSLYPMVHPYMASLRSAFIVEGIKCKTGRNGVKLAILKAPGKVAEKKATKTDK